ncbi:hypothetical protein HPB49_013919 [Dermacentor silvarum]|uniref:Uncharacterized protein n=1 Tax=Dermacentor silvarum TaxID=543639 RepID=A0ACB8C415_DERSI|nr:hypothetical protein HPB49_013919 [Dermacentor silvarum]
MTSFMRRHFKWYGRICKSSGLIIVHGPQTADAGDDIKVSWNKLYLIYSVACISVCAFVEISYFYQIWLAVFVYSHVFTTSLYVVAYVICAIKVVLNVSLTFVNARCLQGIFKEASEYEQRVHFVAPKKQHMLTVTWCLIRPLLLAAFATNVCTSSYLSVEFVDDLSYGLVLSVTLKIASTAGNFLFYVFDVVHSLVLRPCCEVIQLYIRHQHDVLRSVVQNTDNVSSEKRARLIEMIRIDLCTVSNLNHRLNQVWGCSIVASGAQFVCVTCIGIYLSFVEEFSSSQHLLAMTCAITAGLDTLDIASLSDAMVTEVSHCYSST